MSWNTCVAGIPEVEAGHPPREDVSWNNYQRRNCCILGTVILLVRMWVEIVILIHLLPMVLVILLVRMWVEIFNPCCTILRNTSHPPREDVSWNTMLPQQIHQSSVILLVRMWVEITVVVYLLNFVPVILLVRMWVEIHWIVYRKLGTVVILLVRMWVEICQNCGNSWKIKSSSSWGCELKCLGKGDLKDRLVILLVRMWVEM